MPLTVIERRPEWPSLGLECAEFIERYLCHGPGDVQGDAFVLDDEEVDFLLDAYRLYPAGHPRAGRRTVTRAIYSRAKGKRKSELAGAICCFEAFGDCRFEGFGKRLAVIGRPITSPFIRCLATEEGQTGNTYDNVHVMLNHALEKYPGIFGGVDIGLTRVFLPDGGEIRPSTASSSAKDGGKETFRVADETHLYYLPEHRRMLRTVDRNLQKRKIAEPWGLDTTTMFRPGQQSAAEAVFEHMGEVAEGRKSAAGLYLNHREGLEVEDPTDDPAILKSLAEAYYPSDWHDLEKILSDEIHNPEADWADSCRYFLNLRHNAADAAFDVELFKTLARPDVVIAEGEPISLGFDGARFQDSTGIIATHLESGYQWVHGLWERPTDLANDAEWEVNADAVDDSMTEAFDRWKVRRLHADPYYWEEHVDRWSGRWPKKVVKWYTTRERVMALALRAYITAMRTEAELTHDGDLAFIRHIGNARKQPTRAKDDEGRPMFVIRKEHHASPNKIDLAMAGCLSWEARGDAISAGALRERRRRGRAAGF